MNNALYCINGIKSVDTDCIIELIRTITPFHFQCFGVMHQSYDYDEDAIIELLKFEFKHLACRNNILLK